MTQAVTGEHHVVHTASLKRYIRELRWRSFEIGVVFGAIAVALIEVAAMNGAFGNIGCAP